MLNWLLRHVDRDSWIKSACQGGHKDLVLFMIEKGANNWN